MTVMADKPTPEQLRALERFAIIEGRDWKAKLGNAWMNGNYGVHGDISNHLQLLRNNLGPSWLHSFKIYPYTKKTYADMADIIRGIRREVKRRNSIGVNMYTGALDTAAAALDEISGGEQDNFTSECGPREPKTGEAKTAR